MKKIIFTPIYLGLFFLLISWGSDGHYAINEKSTLSFPVSMNAFLVWQDSLAEHGSDADYRKNWDNNESMRHYINIDDYPEFIANGHIPSTYDSVVSAHGQYFVKSKGTLPWATKIMYDSLKLAFQQHNWRAAMLHAADLGHYVADAHQPLHLTKNFDGQLTGNDGIHSSYESSMVYYNYNFLSNYTGDTVHLINNVNEYIFDYIYINYVFVDSIMAADDYAYNLVGNNSTYPYYQALFSKSKYYTRQLFHNASHSLAELIYTAWVEAGSPPFASGIKEISNSKNGNIQLLVYPNPAFSETSCEISLNCNSECTISIFDTEGNSIIAFDKKLFQGKTILKIELSDLSPGVYYLTIKTADSEKTTRLVKLNKY